MGIEPAGESDVAPGVFIDDLIKQVIGNQKLPGPPLAGQFPHQRVEIIEAENSLEAVNHLFYKRGWTDGLPLRAL